MPDTIPGTEDTALKNIKQGPCSPGTCKGLGAALCALALSAMLNSMSSEVVFCIFQIFFLLYKPNQWAASFVLKAM